MSLHPTSSFSTFPIQSVTLTDGRCICVTDLRRDKAIDMKTEPIKTQNRVKRKSHKLCASAEGQKSRILTRWSLIVWNRGSVWSGRPACVVSIPNSIMLYSKGRFYKSTAIPLMAFMGRQTGRAWRSTEAHIIRLNKVKLKTPQRKRTMIHTEKLCFDMWHLWTALLLMCDTDSSRNMMTHTEMRFELC